ncbi:MAG: 3'-5' exoribonuclease [Minisyncoccia bacterium]
MIALDIETSGLIPGKHGILAIGAVDFDDPTNQFYDECRLWEGACIDEAALAINGFSHEEITDASKKSEGELIRDFIAWATDRPKDQTCAGQNPSFDRDFVNAACKRAGLEFPFAHRTIDTHTLCWLHMIQHGIEPPTKNSHSAISLDTALRYCGMPEEPKPHNALTGALSHAEVIARIAYTKKLIPDFFTYDIPWNKTT